MNRQFQMSWQMLDMQKASAEIMLKNLIAMWEQTALFFKGASWMSAEGRRAVIQWADLNRKACEGFKSALESGYSNLKSFFPS